jgi:nucleoid-associated protein YgaU
VVSRIKNFLKNIKLHESTVSTVLGFLVIVVVGLLVVNYFRNLDSGETFPTGASTEEGNGRPESYTVAAGDSLWSISEKVYGSGYNWVDIRDANNIENPNDIKEGQVLAIPNVVSRADGDQLAQASPSPEPTATPSPSPTIRPVLTPTPSPEGMVASGEDESIITKEHIINAQPASTYIVVRGDNLWDIAEAAYGDGFRWVDIAKANNLANPRIIHAGNVLTIPA